MNDIINKFLLALDKFMLEMHLRNPFVKKYIACDPVKKHKQKIQRFIKTGDRSVIFKNKLDEACFQHDMAYKKYKDLEKRTQLDRTFQDKAFKIDGYERGLASMVYKFFDKKSKGAGILNQQLANERHKPIIRKFKKRKVYSIFGVLI